MLQDLEKPILPDEKKKVIEAIHSLGLRVSPSEIAEKSDLPVLVAARELNRLATETGAHLEVTGSGSVLYSFDPRFEQSYALFGPKNFLRRSSRIIINSTLIVMRALVLAGIFIIRISFGVLLIASVVALVVIAIVALIAMLRGADGDGGGGDGLNLDIGDLGSVGDAFSSQWSLSFWCFDWLWDWIFFPRYLWSPYGLGGWGYGWGYGSYYDYYDQTSYSEPYNTARDRLIRTDSTDSAPTQEKKPRTKFMDSCFALLFGAEDPNYQVEKKRWQDIASVIRLNQGVVVSEQFAPYVDGIHEDEDWMLPILTRFNGLPDVTESGHIIYLFPAFISALSTTVQSPQEQHSRTQSNFAPANDADQLRALYTGHLKRQKVIKQSDAQKAVLERYLKEENLVLLPQDGQYESVFLFVGLAIALSLGLLFAGHSIHFLQLLNPLFYGILGYSSLFFIFPTIRWFSNDRTNKAIDGRNNRRLEASAKLSSPSSELQQKLEEARGIAIASAAELDGRVVYSTREDFLEQEFDSSRTH